MDRATILRAAAVLAAGAAFAGSTAYVVAHPKNPVAPLQPPVASPAPAPAQAAATAGTGRAAPAPTPRITLQPGVRATALPGITYTHVS